LVSGHPAQPFAISAVNDSRVRTLADLDNAVANAVATSSGKDAVVEFAVAYPGTPPAPARVRTCDLVALAHTCVPERQAVRIVDEGNPWVLLKDGAVRCKLMLRKERNSNLIHVVTSLKVCWGQPRKLPRALGMNCDGNPLRCLSVSEVLDQLYGEKKRDDTQPALAAFTEIAESDEFVTPVNYRLLETKLAKDQRLASSRPYPAFAVVGGYAYPGPPVLGDARALSGFMLQPRVYSSEEPEHVGWVVFDATSQAGRGDFEVVVDVGSGPQHVHFRIPNLPL
jgi:hypothetical protein